MKPRLGMSLTGFGCLSLCVVCSFLAAVQSYSQDLASALNGGAVPVKTLVNIIGVVAVNAFLCIVLLVIVGGVWSVGRRWWASLPEK